MLRHALSPTSRNIYRRTVDRLRHSCSRVWSRRYSSKEERCAALCPTVAAPPSFLRTRVASHVPHSTGFGNGSNNKDSQFVHIAATPRSGAPRLCHSNYYPDPSVVSLSQDTTVADADYIAAPSSANHYRNVYCPAIECRCCVQVCCSVQPKVKCERIFRLVLARVPAARVATSIRRTSHGESFQHQRCVGPHEHARLLKGVRNSFSLPAASNAVHVTNPSSYRVRATRSVL